MAYYKIINGRGYDTGRDLALATHQHGIDSDSDYYYEETLFKKSNGKGNVELYIHGKGGSHSRYGVWFEDGCKPGEDIRLISESSAKEWAERHLDGYEYEKIFGRVYA